MSTKRIGAAFAAGAFASIIAASIADSIGGFARTGAILARARSETHSKQQLVIARRIAKMRLRRAVRGP
ncbi:MAG TPA: hypothetical protein VH044_00405 [Polyangiaceae bacterium]|nr:hypothetical protein [Polyangiaceae bacterium]